MTEIKKRPNKNFDCYAVPDFTQIVTTNASYSKKLSEAMNYAHYVYELSELKDFAKEYTKNKFSITSVPDYEFHHLGVLCWIINNGGQLNIDGLKELNDRLLTLSQTYKNETVKKERTSTPDSTADVIADLEGYLDDISNAKEVDLKKILSDKTFSASKIKDHFKAQFDQFDNDDFNEYFDKQDKQFKKWIKEILDEVDNQTIVKKKTSTRIPRKISPSKMVKKVTYLKDFPDLSLKSIHPEFIIGTDLVWIYNTKNQKLYKFVSQNNTGLLIKGTSVINYDEEKSTMKKLRKPKEILDKILNSGKVDQRKIYEGIRAVEKPVSPRINKDCLIVKVNK